MIYNESGKIMNEEFLIMEFFNKESKLDQILSEDYIFDDDKLSKIANKAWNKIKEIPKLLKSIINKITEAIKSAIDWLSTYTYISKNRGFIIKNKPLIKEKLDALNNSDTLGIFSQSSKDSTIGDIWRSITYYLYSPGYENGKFIDTFIAATNNFENYSVPSQVLSDLFPTYDISIDSIYKRSDDSDIAVGVVDQELFDYYTRDWFFNMDMYVNGSKDTSTYSDEIINYSLNFSSIVKPLKTAHNQYRKFGQNVEKINGKVSVIIASILHNYFISAMKCIRKLSTSCVTLCIKVLQPSA